MKKFGFFLFAVAVALSISVVGKTTASKTFPKCAPSPDDICQTGPGGETLIFDARNR